MITPNKTPKETQVETRISLNATVANGHDPVKPTLFEWLAVSLVLLPLMWAIASYTPPSETLQTTLEPFHTGY